MFRVQNRNKMDETDNLAVDASPENANTYLVKQVKIPEKSNLPPKFLLDICKELDEDDIRSIRFLLHGYKKQYNFKIPNNLKCDSLNLPQYFHQLAPYNKEELFNLLKELMFIIKRYDILHKHFKTCHLKEAETPNNLIDKIWQKLFVVYENMVDEKLADFKKQLHMFDKRSAPCDDVLIQWYNSCDSSQIAPNEMLDKISSALHRTGLPDVAIKLQDELEPDQDYYPMDKRPCGTAVIFNNISFDRPDINERKGSGVDSDKMKEVLKTYGFEVKVHDNCTTAKMESVLSDLAKSDHSHKNAFICCVLSHGLEGLFYTKDGSFKIKKLKSMFSSVNAPTLTDKPKLFFIQACQAEANKTDDQDEKNIEKDGPAKDAPPEMADMLVSCATVEGEVSYRDVKNGTWYIQTLASVLLKFGEKLDIKDILMKVNDEVAKIRAVKNSQIVKQMPTQWYTLRKKLVLKKNT